MKVECFSFAKESDLDIVLKLQSWWIKRVPSSVRVCMEHVWAQPGQNINQMKMVANHNLVLGAMYADGVYDKALHIIPSKWQQHHGLGDVYVGNATKKQAYEIRKKAWWKAAEKLFPKEKILKPTADAYLLALYAMQKYPSARSWVGIDPGMSGAAVLIIPEMHFSEMAYYKPGMGFICQEDYDV
jgi:hypothetical protein